MDIMTRGAFAKPGTSLDYKTGTWRDEKPAHKHWAAPCHADCPAGEDAQAWLAKMQENRLQEAWEELVATNPMPAITGRVCPHPCEIACNRGLYDKPIAIHLMERFLGDEAIRHGWSYPVPSKLGRDAPKVAVVGAGPAGVSAAYHLIRRGIRPTLFEALPEAGGLLRSAIPMTRLPRDVMDEELGRILSTGIELRLRQKLGRDVSMDELRQDYQAVFLGPGCQHSKTWSVDGVTPHDLHEGLQLLKEWVDHGTIPVPKRVLVHGGGNTAMDICRVMKRHGAEDVVLVTASGLPGPDTAPDDVLNVVPRELEEGIEEGIVIHPHCTIQRLLMRGSRVVGVELVSLKKLPGADGRKSRVSFEGTERVLNVDMVVPCIGEDVDAEGMEKIIGSANYFWPDDWGRLSKHPGVFVGGDARGDRGTVAGAVGDGRKTALAIERMIAGQGEPQEESRPRIDLETLNLTYFDRAPRAGGDKVPPDERTDFTEIEIALDASQASAEAQRCFSCGDCLACDNCWTLCPDNAVVKTVEVASDGSNYVFDYDYCKGCGLCAYECPTGYIIMGPDL
jgi:formate dehydrogenase (NADP+) beta subunit